MYSFSTLSEKLEVMIDKQINKLFLRVIKILFMMLILDKISIYYGSILIFNIISIAIKVLGGVAVCVTISNVKAIAKLTKKQIEAQEAEQAA